MQKKAEFQVLKIKDERMGSNWHGISCMNYATYSKVTYSFFYITNSLEGFLCWLRRTSEAGLFTTGELICRCLLSKVWRRQLVLKRYWQKDCLSATQNWIYKARLHDLQLCLWNLLVLKCLETLLSRQRAAVVQWSKDLSWILEGHWSDHSLIYTG